MFFTLKATLSNGRIATHYNYFTQQKVDIVDR